LSGILRLDFIAAQMPHLAQALRNSSIVAQPDGPVGPGVRGVALRCFTEIAMRIGLGLLVRFIALWYRLAAYAIYAPCCHNVKLFPD